jgi:glycosyltransferase involved in cell wall biosynthesis
MNINNPEEFSQKGSELAVLRNGRPKGKSEGLLRKNRELRVEIDKLRLENQTLHIEREHFSNLRYLIHVRVRAAWQKARHRISYIKWQIRGKMAGELHYENNYSSTFKPYQVRILHPPQPDRRRVLHAVGNFYTGGSAQLVVELVEHLGHRFEQVVITRDLPDVPGYTGLNIHHYERFTNPRQALSQLKKFKPDIIHVHYLGHHNNPYSERDWKWYNNLFLAAQEYGCKIIENINIPVEPYVSHSVTCYIYVSDYVRHEFGRLDCPNITIYPGSNCTLFTRRDEMGIPDDCIGMVYRLEGDKLDEHSIDVFVKVVERRRKTKALIIGGGRYLNFYRNIVHQARVADAITFTGYVSYEDLPPLYEQMSIFVAPVHKESFGQVSPFAMSMGIPVVGYDVGALKEVTGDCGLLAAPGDSDALADIIIALLNDRERRLKIGEMNRKRAVELFSVEAMIDSYSKLYEELIKSV